MQNKLAIIIHGPAKDNAYEKIFGSLNYLNASKISYQVFIVSYIHEEVQVRQYCDAKSNRYNIKYVFCKDLINPGYFNLNRQIYTVKAALDLIEHDTFVVKLRNDQWINWSKLLQILEKLDFLKSRSQTILSTNCFTRKDRLYHPSDMFLCGWQPDMINYFSIPPTQDTHFNCQLFMLEKLRNTSLPFYSYLISPESELFRFYLTRQGWAFKETFEDSYFALKKYIYILNTWDIDLRWNKRRNANLPAGTIILPYRFNLEPFAGAPKETARCFIRQDFYGKKHLRDHIFLAWARVVFDWKYKVKYDSKKVMCKLIYNIPISPDLRSKILASNVAGFMRQYLSK